MFSRKTEEIELFGKKLLLSERTAGDVNRLIVFSEKIKDKKFTDMIIEASIILEDSLKINYENLKWYEYFKKRKLKKILSKGNIVNSLSAKEIFNLAEKVYELEGIDFKKKVPRKGKKSAGT
jgi:hypothetical protein